MPAVGFKEEVFLRELGKHAPGGLGIALEGHDKDVLFRDDAGESLVGQPEHRRPVDVQEFLGTVLPRGGPEPVSGSAGKNDAIVVMVHIVLSMVYVYMGIHAWGK